MIQAAPGGMTLLRVGLCLAWVCLLLVSVRAVQRMGVGAAGQVFLGDFAHPWRAQFNTDFSIYLLLVAAWMVYRARTWWAGLLCALLAVNFGGLFTLAYLLLASLNANGDPRVLLLGRYRMSSRTPL